MSILIVLFGQENDTDGKLRYPAAARCAKAADLWKQLAPGNEVVILPTGSFGQHFNLSDEPHFHYLTRELIRLEVPPENILPGVASSNTLQDATEAWYRFKNGGFHRLIAVTSDYHANRVELILGRLAANDDVDLEVVTADTPSGYQGKDKLLEDEKVERLKREWVNVIPRTSKMPPERLALVYAEAAAEHKHYDTLSLAVVSALFIVNAFAFTVIKGKSGLLLVFMLLAVAAIDVLLWSLYSRMADAARTARRVLSRIEIEHRMPGFSSNWRPETVEWFRSPPWMWSMKELVTALATLVFVALVIISLMTFGEPQVDLSQGSTRSGNTNINSPNVNSAPTTSNVSANGNAIDRFANAVIQSRSNSNTNTNTRRRR